MFMSKPTVIGVWACACPAPPPSSDNAPTVNPRVAALSRTHTRFLAVLIGLAALKSTQEHEETKMVVWSPIRSAASTPSLPAHPVA